MGLYRYFKNHSSLYCSIVFVLQSQKGVNEKGREILISMNALKEIGTRPVNVLLLKR